MPTQQTITVGVDGSPGSLDAADWAAGEALRRDLPLRLIHAHEPPGERGRFDGSDAAARLETGVLERSVQQLSRWHPELEIIDDRVSGSPAGALLAAAPSSALVVIGSHGAGRLTNVMVGSAALAVATRASCPVALVRAADTHDDKHGDAADRPVVLGLDLDRRGDELLEYAFDAAASRRAPLHVVHVWTAPMTEESEAVDPMPDKERLMASELSSWRRKFPETHVDQRLVHDAAGHHLVQSTSNACLLVIGRLIPTGPHLGETAHAAIHQARCPVVIVPHN
ncbi:universal stress protein [Streptomyces sp. NPDC051218]|uniref:universal stress protein n=1 Tax=Streptomyces sp. NPDC051218 TaxID=3365645 RepID=UPI00378F7626